MSAPIGLAVVLSGGGSRGAYEVGVLSYVFGDLVRKVGHAPSVDLISGTSVGAVNGAFLASTVDDLPRGVAALETMWSDLRLADVVSFSFQQAMSLHRVLLGGRKAPDSSTLPLSPSLWATKWTGVISPKTFGRRSFGR